MKILIFGATSAIAQAFAEIYAPEGHDFFLLARSPAKLQSLADRLLQSGAGSVRTEAADLAEPDRQWELVANASAALGGIDVALIAFGELSDQNRVNDPAYALDQLRVNFAAAASLAEAVTDAFLTQDRGRLAVIASVAGDRGRKSNYLYGAAKAGLDCYLEGLRHKLAGHPHIHVLTVKPGFVDTPMTAHLPRNPLYVSPQTVARKISRSLDRAIVYSPAYWRAILWIIRLLPRWVFHRLDL